VSKRYLVEVMISTLRFKEFVTVSKKAPSLEGEGTVSLDPSKAAAALPRRETIPDAIPSKREERRSQLRLTSA